MRKKGLTYEKGCVTNEPLFFFCGREKAVFVETGAEVAQSVEQRTENPRVPSSILGLGTIKIKGLGHLQRSFNPSFCANCA